MNPITFPGLGLEFHINRVAFFVFGKPIYWYGIIIAVGFVLAVTYCYYNAARYGIQKDRVIDLVLFAAPGGIIGARIYYVLFYQELYRNADGSFNWKEAIAIWDGGLAIYGGVIVAVLILLIFCKVHKIKFAAFADLGSYGLFIGQSIGRWGNFCNQEAFGGLTDLPWRMGLTVAGEYIEVHPTFLYESVWNLTGFVVLHFLSKKRKFDGQMFLAYLAWYGAGRMVIEGLRTDSLWLGPVRVSQLLAAVTMLLALGILLYHAIFVRHDPAKMQVNRVAAAEAAAATAAEAQPEEGAEPSGEASEQEDEASEESEESIGPDESKE